MGRSILAVGRKNSAHGRESVLNHWGDVHKWCLPAGQVWNDPGRPAGAASSCCPTMCKCSRCTSSFIYGQACKVKEVRRKKEKGGTEVTLLFDRCTVQVVQVAGKKKDETGDFGGWRKVAGA